MTVQIYIQVICWLQKNYVFCFGDTVKGIKSVFFKLICGGWCDGANQQQVSALIVPQNNYYYLAAVSRHCNSYKHRSISRSGLAICYSRVAIVADKSTTLQAIHHFPYLKTLTLHLQLQLIWFQMICYNLVALVAVMPTITQVIMSRSHSNFMNAHLTRRTKTTSASTTILYFVCSLLTVYQTFLTNVSQRTRDLTVSVAFMVMNATLTNT